MVSSELVHYLTHSIRPRPLEHSNRLDYIRINISMSVSMSDSVGADDSKEGSKSVRAMMHMVR